MGQNVMSTTEIPSHWQLSIANRLIRAAIGIVSILSALLNDELSEGWVFVLAVLGMYTSQTAFFKIELLHAFFSLPEIEATSENEEQATTSHRSKIDK